jgi:hypothetical protein
MIRNYLTVRCGETFGEGLERGQSVTRLQRGRGTRERIGQVDADAKGKRDVEESRSMCRGVLQSGMIFLGLHFTF